MSFFHKIKSLISKEKGTDKEIKGLDQTSLTTGVTSNGENTVDKLMSNRKPEMKIQYLLQQNRQEEADALIIEYIWKKLANYEFKVYNFGYAISYVKKNSSVPVYHQFMKDVLKKRPEEKNFGSIYMRHDEFIAFLAEYKNIYQEELKQFLNNPPQAMSFSHMEAVADMVYGEEITTDHEEIVKKYYQQLIQKKSYSSAEEIIDSEKRGYLLGKEEKDNCIKGNFANAIQERNIYSDWGVIALYEQNPDVLERSSVVKILQSELAKQKRKKEFKGHWFTIGCRYRLPIYKKYGVMDEETELFAKQQYVLGALEAGSSLSLPKNYNIESYTHGYIPPKVYAKHFGIGSYLTSRDSEIITAAKQGVRSLFSKLGDTANNRKVISAGNGQEWDAGACNVMIKYLNTFKLWKDEDMSEIVTYYTTYIKPHRKVA